VFFIESFGECAGFLFGQRLLEGEQLLKERLGVDAPAL